ncbi:hypothetical protein V6N13_069577 [Hibiscus sabdariffa]
MQRLEAKVRECYEEASDHLNSQEFVEMMVYDACFIVQLILGDADEDLFKDSGNDFKQSNYDTITVNTAAFGEYYNFVGDFSTFRHRLDN